MGGEENGNVDCESHRGGTGVLTGSAESYGCI